MPVAVSRSNADQGTQREAQWNGVRQGQAAGSPASAHHMSQPLWPPQSQKYPQVPEERISPPWLPSPRFTLDTLEPLGWLTPRAPTLDWQQSRLTQQQQQLSQGPMQLPLAKPLALQGTLPWTPATASGSPSYWRPSSPAYLQLSRGQDGFHVPPGPFAPQPVAAQPGSVKYETRAHYNFSGSPHGGEQRGRAAVPLLDPQCAPLARYLPSRTAAGTEWSECGRQPYMRAPTATAAQPDSPAGEPPSPFWQRPSAPLTPARRPEPPVGAPAGGPWHADSILHRSVPMGQLVPGWTEVPPYGSQPHPAPPPPHHAAAAEAAAPLQRARRLPPGGQLPPLLPPGVGAQQGPAAVPPPPPLQMPLYYAGPGMMGAMPGGSYPYPQHRALQRSQPMPHRAAPQLRTAGSGAGKFVSPPSQPLTQAPPLLTRHVHRPEQQAPEGEHRSFSHLPLPPRPHSPLLHLPHHHHPQLQQPHVTSGGPLTPPLLGLAADRGWEGDYCPPPPPSQAQSHHLPSSSTPPPNAHELGTAAQPPRPATAPTPPPSSDTHQCAAAAAPLQGAGGRPPPLAAPGPTQAHHHLPPHPQHSASSFPPRQLPMSGPGTGAAAPSQLLHMADPQRTGPPAPPPGGWAGAPEPENSRGAADAARGPGSPAPPPAQMRAAHRRAAVTRFLETQSLEVCAAPPPPGAHSIMWHAACMQHKPARSGHPGSDHAVMADLGRKS